MKEEVVWKTTNDCERCGRKTTEDLSKYGRSCRGSIPWLLEYEAGVLATQPWLSVLKDFY